MSTSNHSTSDKRLELRIDIMNELFSYNFSSRGVESGVPEKRFGDNVMKLIDAYAQALAEERVREARIDEAKRSRIHVGFNMNATSETVKALEQLRDSHNSGVQERVAALQKDGESQ